MLYSQMVIRWLGGTPFHLGSKSVLFSHIGRMTRGWQPALLESLARENAKIQMAALVLLMDLSFKYLGRHLDGFWRSL
jgi:hypothetical protein